MANCQLQIQNFLLNKVLVIKAKMLQNLNGYSSWGNLQMLNKNN